MEDTNSDFYRTSALIKPKPTDVWGLKFFPDLEPDCDNNRDAPMFNWPNAIEVSDCNIDVITKVLARLGDRYKACMDIGVDRNGERSMSRLYMTKKPADAIYVGVDIHDKSYLDDANKNIWTVKANSHEQEKIRAFLKDKGIDRLDILAIDGWHSVNTTINDWRYADLLSDHGVVIVHDTNHHPGDIALCNAVDENLFDIDRCCTSFDSGITVFSRKSGK